MPSHLAQIACCRKPVCALRMEHRVFYGLLHGLRCHDGNRIRRAFHLARCEGEYGVSIIGGMNRLDGASISVMRRRRDLRRLSLRQFGVREDDADRGVLRDTSPFDGNFFGLRT